MKTNWKKAKVEKNEILPATLILIKNTNHFSVEFDSFYYFEGINGIKVKKLRRNSIGFDNDKKIIEYLSKDK